MIPEDIKHHSSNYKSYLSESFQRYLQEYSLNVTPKIVECFLEEFYANFAVFYTQQQELEAINHLIHNLLALITRPVDLALPQITVQQNTGLTVIQILCAAKNSEVAILIQEIVQRFALAVSLIVNLPLNTQRDSQGKLLDLTASAHKGANELIMHLEIAETLASTQLDILINELRQGITAKIASGPLFIKAIENALSNPEAKQLITWLQANRFIFLSCLRYDPATHHSTAGTGIISSQALEQFVHQGIATSVHIEHFKDHATLILGVGFKIADHYQIVLGTFRDQKVHAITSLASVYTRLLESSAGLTTNHHYLEQLRSAIRTLPGELLLILQTAPHFLEYLLYTLIQPSLKIFIHQTQHKSLMYLLVCVPINRYSQKLQIKIQQHLAQNISSKFVIIYPAAIIQGVAYLPYVVEVTALELSTFSSQYLEQELSLLLSSWDEQLMRMVQSSGLEVASSHIFNKPYKHTHKPEQGYQDLEQAVKSFEGVIFHFFQGDITVPETTYLLKIYKPHDSLRLQEIFPILENLGLALLQENSYPIHLSTNTSVWLHELILTSQHKINEEHFFKIRLEVEAMLRALAVGTLKNTPLNQLIITANFSLREIQLTTALLSYLAQIQDLYPQELLIKTIVKYPAYSRLLMQIFTAKFDPYYPYERQVEQLLKITSQSLENVKDILEDRILKLILAALNAIIRTNAYQMKSGEHKPYLSFKISPTLIPDMVPPIPYAEIYVYSKDFEGIHLRGGKIARGGIRWSDRAKDYRMEVLGLMKAQLTKNSIIVPVGAKGGFYIKAHYPTLQFVIQCYQDFLRGLLDITDNIIEGHITPPQHTIIYDQADPYLVVAADKGTASFSDYANQVAQEYNFWLKDAFASGGAAGYDHKKLGITSKGTWISVLHHLQAENIDLHKDYITVVGIGDMSGDVFGNGMLRSDKLKLLAAFNHIHIFLDPNPDPQISYQERLRLFNKPKSTWLDYNPQLISAGGGVFLRSEKKLKLSPEVQRMLDLNNEFITPAEVIRAILTAKVDLLWNGGIGTYVRAAGETNKEIGDSANDEVRCLGRNIRARIVAEAGNLGFSQRARIEYSSFGGRINADFIDNSAGVDCSDHEVNIKIALNQALVKDKISLDERNRLLQQMTPEVEALVLSDNYQQNLAISLTIHATPLGILQKLVQDLEEQGILNRAIEYLPSDLEFTRRLTAGETITRPEVAVILSYSKMWIYQKLLNSEVVKEPVNQRILLSYFPVLMQYDFQEEILKHLLFREIIINKIANEMVNKLGGALINTINLELDRSIEEIAKAYLIIMELFQLDEIWQKVEKAPLAFMAKLQVLTALSKIIYQGIIWILKYKISPLNIQDILKYQLQIFSLKDQYSALFAKESMRAFENRVNSYLNDGLAHDLAIEIALLANIISFLDITAMAQELAFEPVACAKLYFTLTDILGIDYLVSNYEPSLPTHWQYLSTQTIRDDIYYQQKKLSTKVISKMQENSAWSMHEFTQFAMPFLKFITETKAIKLDASIMVLASKKLEALFNKL